MLASLDADVSPTEETLGTATIAFAMGVVKLRCVL
jgi:hypothetical protein